ncbi:MAG TPA: protein translocase subunit SecF [Calditerricola sp.]
MSSNQRKHSDLFAYRYDFIKYRRVSFLVSGILLALGLVVLFVFGLKLGVDFQAGTRIEVDAGKPVDAQRVVEAAAAALGGLKPAAVETGGEGERVVLRYAETLTKDQIAALRKGIAEALVSEASFTESTVDPLYARELARKAAYAVLIASVGIALYVMLRFEYRFAVAALVALFHDAFMTIAAFSLLRLEVDLPFIAAVLTIVGYSINDTIVIFDRIRENLKFAQRLKTAEDLARLVNASLNQTLTRSINTVLTVLFTAVALFFLGGEGIRNFSLALIIGLVSGTYSSIFIASQIWYEWKVRELRRPRAKAVENAS